MDARLGFFQGVPAHPQAACSKFTFPSEDIALQTETAIGDARLSFSIAGMRLSQMRLPSDRVRVEVLAVCWLCVDSGRPVHLGLRTNSAMSCCVASSAVQAGGPGAPLGVSAESQASRTRAATEHRCITSTH